MLSLHQSNCNVEFKCVANQCTMFLFTFYKSSSGFFMESMFVPERGYY